MAFDDEPPYAPRRAPSARRTPPDRQRQLMARRAVAAGIGVVILILIVLGVKGCLNARKTRSFENFNADLRSLVSQTNTLSKDFFDHLQNPASGNKLTFQTQLKTDAGTAATLSARAQAISTPGELSVAHGDLDLAYDLRANALTAIADELAGGKTNQATTNRVVAQMKQLIASDVIYSRAQSEIDQGFMNNGIDEQAPPSQFVPDPQEKWITPSTIDGILSGVGVSGGGGGTVSGVHGTGIAGATLGGSTLTPDTPLTVASVPPNTLSISIQNQGDATERNIQVRVAVSGGGANTSKQTTVGSIAAGSLGTADVALGSVPTGTPLTITVKVAPVLGEHVTTNNNATYNVTFQ